MHRMPASSDRGTNGSATVSPSSRPAARVAAGASAEIAEASTSQDRQMVVQVHSGDNLPLLPSATAFQLQISSDGMHSSARLFIPAKN